MKSWLILELIQECIIRRSPLSVPLHSQDSDGVVGVHHAWEAAVQPVRGVSAVPRLCLAGITQFRQREAISLLLESVSLTHCICQLDSI